MLEASPIPVVASGGVGTLAHIRSLVGLHVGTRQLAGVIVGRALYEREFTIEAAVAATGAGA
jgi:phosphoribosylformimino-5-aminoimidazole carboxamide ribotide isomerase